MMKYGIGISVILFALAYMQANLNSNQTGLTRDWVTRWDRRRQLLRGTNLAMTNPSRH